MLGREGTSWIGGKPRTILSYVCLSRTISPPDYFYIRSDSLFRHPARGIFITVVCVDNRKTRKKKVDAAGRGEKYKGGVISNDSICAAGCFYLSVSPKTEESS